MTLKMFNYIVTTGDPPFIIETEGGRSYTIHDRQSFWVPPSWQRTVILAVPGKGITYLDIETIEAVRVEHEPVRPTN